MFTESYDGALSNSSLQQDRQQSNNITQNEVNVASPPPQQQHHHHRQQQKSYHRSLRMRPFRQSVANASHWGFSISTSQQSCIDRIKSFHEAFQIAINNDDINAIAISKFDHKMRQFGYSVTSHDWYTYLNSSTQFDEWDLMFNVEGRTIPQI